MDKAEVLDSIRAVGLIPVIRARSPEEAREVAGAIQAGGVPILEITMTVPGAVEVIQEMAGRGGETLVGAGTVLDPDAALQCIEAGARFIVSPNLNLETIAACREAGVAVLPGALTPTEVLTAWRAGADLVKVFPAGAVGGAGYIKALKAPLPQVDLVPTGGVNLDTAAGFIRAGASALGVGADLVDLAAVRRGEASAVTDRARAYRSVVEEARRGA